jgi:putative tryptophan/tyrosine transport system substrate-binding protein
VVSYFLRYFPSTSTEQISGFRRTFHQFRSGWLCYFCYSRAGRLARECRAFVDKVLKGIKPTDIPIEQATKFDFVLNVKTARALGLDVPTSILLRADEVIE